MELRLGFSTRISAGLFGTRFPPVNPISEGRINMYRNYRVLAEHSNWFRQCAVLPKPGQPARMSRFGQFKGQTSQNVKDTGDRPHDT
ncbi:hypothetical protein LXL04_033633 [Taraxacum kok-saghyz]